MKLQTEQEQLPDYQRIEKAIGYIRQFYKERPSLDEMAAHVHLSRFHFQRLFLKWTGVSPKEFIQLISIEHARQILRNSPISLFAAALETGLSGNARLHDLFIKIEKMSPAEYRNGGESLLIEYSFATTEFGSIMIASTAIGICRLVFYDHKEEVIQELKKEFPKALLIEKSIPLHASAIACISGNSTDLKTIKLHVKASEFRLKVWECLLNIPRGELRSYGQIAKETGNPAASRATGSAIGENPVAFLIPCHRVIRASGEMGEYRWGINRKALLISKEQTERSIREKK